MNIHVYYFDQFRFPGIKNVISRLEDIILFSSIIFYLRI